MIVLGIDPGKLMSTAGVAKFDSVANRVPYSLKDATLPSIVALLDASEDIELVAIERCRAGQHANNDYMETAEMVGSLRQACIERKIPCVCIPRGDVLSVLRIRGGKGSKDSKVTARLRDDLIGPKGRKADKGPTFGVSGHAWQALGVAWAAHEMATVDSAGVSRRAGIVWWTP